MRTRFGLAAGAASATIAQDDLEQPKPVAKTIAATTLKSRRN